MPNLLDELIAEGLKFRVGDEWTDGYFNYIIVKIEDVLNHDNDRVIRFVTVFDGEGCVDRCPAVAYATLTVEEDLTPVTEPLAERLASWREGHPTFPL